MDIAYSFIIIDDSELDCYVTQKFLEHFNKSLNIQSFQNAQDALEMIRENPIENSLVPVMILLDLQMPMMSGYEFVVEFEKLPPEIRKNYKIIILTILSPTKDPNDTYKVLTYAAVNGVIEKPLTKEKLLSLIHPGRQDI